MVKFDETSGMRGLKQIHRSLMIRGDITPGEKYEVFEHHVHNYLNRCFPGWVRGK